MVVTAADERQLNRLENQVDNGGGGAWEYLCLVRKLKARRSDKVFKFGLSILKDPKARSRLGNEEWTLYEQVAIAALDCQYLVEAKNPVADREIGDGIEVGRFGKEEDKDGSGRRNERRDSGERMRGREIRSNHTLDERRD
ncbi:hypothetical protein ACLOJK_033574 [Asimina triloba]